MSAEKGWAELLGRLEPHVSPEWSRHAQEHGEQGWIRLILLVDAHHQLSTPRISEKIAMTMADLAVDRGKEAEGWEAVRAAAQEQRIELVAYLVDSSEALLSSELMALFVRSIEPLSGM
jgi:hypothetical protein